MERLTEICWRNLDPWECCGQDYYCKRGCHDKGGCINGCVVPKVYCRLAAYEDTGLTPEEIADTASPDALIKLAAQALGTTPERLRELAAADKERRVVVLPCKVGDTVYFVNANRILEFTVVGYAVGETGISWVYSEHVDKTGHTNGRTFSPDRFGMNTFLTREEAERALEGRKNA